MPFRLHAVLLLIAAFSPQNCPAAFTEYQWFDLPSCKRGYLTTDTTNPNAFVPGSAILIKAAGWEVFESSAACLGFCRRTKDNLFTCRKDSCPHFPLAGATYKPFKDDGSLESLICIAGCRAGIPRMIHDMGYENDESDRNIEFDRRLTRFNAKCSKRAGG